jgi:hypothetical protein
MAAGFWPAAARAQDEIVAQIQKTSTPPVIDGLGDDAVWATATAHGNDEFFTVVGAEPEDEADLSVTWKALWDDAKLYVMVEVTDNQIFNDEECNWDDDGIELYIDAQNVDSPDYQPANNDPPPDGVPAYQLTAIAGDPTGCGKYPDDRMTAFSWGINSYHDLDDEIAQYPQGQDVSKTVVRDENHFTLEAEFPWEAIEDTPANIMGRPLGMGFGVAVNDDDDDFDEGIGGTRDSQYMWATQQADLWMRSDTFPQVQLVGSATLAGDFDADGDIDAADIDRISMAVRSGETATQFDLNGNGTVNADDRSHLIGTIIKTYLGDANLDKQFSSADFVAVFTIGEYEDPTNGNSGWADGDWNGDGDFNSGDFVAAFTEGGYEKGPKPATAAVPEPSGIAMLLFGLLLVARRRRA